MMSQRALIAPSYDNLPSQLFVPPSSLVFFSPFKQVKGPAKYQFKHETKTCVFFFAGAFKQWEKCAISRRSVHILFDN